MMMDASTGQKRNEKSRDLRTRITKGKKAKMENGPIYLGVYLGNNKAIKCSDGAYGVL